MEDKGKRLATDCAVAQGSVFAEATTDKMADKFTDYAEVLAKS